MSVLSCNFCGKDQDEVKRLWGNDREDWREPLVFICNFCIESAFRAQVESGLNLGYVQAGDLPG